MLNKETKIEELLKKLQEAFVRIADNRQSAWHANQQGKSREVFECLRNILSWELGGLVELGELAQIMGVDLPSPDFKKAGSSRPCASDEGEEAQEQEQIRSDGSNMAGAEICVDTLCEAFEPQQTSDC